MTTNYEAERTVLWRRILYNRSPRIIWEEPDEGWFFGYTDFDEEGRLVFAFAGGFDSREGLEEYTAKMRAACMSINTGVACEWAPPKVRNNETDYNLHHPFVEYPL